MTIAEKAFVISLKIRQDRQKAFFARMPETDLLPPVEVWDAVHGDTCVPPDNWHAGNGAWGCYRSHMAILEKCLNGGVESYIVFEDDAVFVDDFNERLGEFLSRLPTDWHQVYLGGQLLHTNAHPPIRVCDGVYRPYNVNRTHCFAARGDGMLAMYRHLSNLPFHTSEHIDHHLGRWHETYRYNVYCPGKWLVGQGGGSSNVSGKTEPITFYDNPEDMAMDHPLYRYPACVVYRGPRDVVERLCDEFCHKGYNLDRAGYDRGLAEAWKYKDSATEIKRWYSCVRSEIVREKKQKVPVLWHPRVSDEMVEEANLGNIVTVETDEYEKAAEMIQRLIQHVWSHE